MSYEVQTMATRCPDCGNFMRLIGTDDDKNGKHRSHYWCSFEGVYMRIPDDQERAARIKRPEMSRAYNEFNGYLTKRESSLESWLMIFFKLNDPRDVGLCVGAIMGVHPLERQADGWGFDVSTTSCTKIRFDYESEAMAKQDRSRLLLVIEAYHASDAEI